MKHHAEIKGSQSLPSAAQSYLNEQDQADLRIPENSRKRILAYTEKHTADLLTLSRVILGLVLVGSGVIDGKADLAHDIRILVLAWSTDMVDGRISRSLKTNHQTWLGRNDVYVDMFVSVAVLVYLAATGLVGLGSVLIYLLLWSALFWRWGIPPIFAQVFQNPIYAYFVFLTVRSAPAVVPWLLLWALVAFLLFWRKLFELLRNVFTGNLGG